MKLRLAVLGSTQGTHLLSLIKAIQEQRLSASIEVVISNQPEARILERAREHHLRAFYLAPAQLTREQYDQQVSEKLQEFKIDFVMLVGFMRILSGRFIAEWRNKIVNVHPSLLPAFAGGMNNDVHRAVLESGVEESGCTVHLVTEEVDAGPILIQKKCTVSLSDNIDSLKAKVQALEAEALIEVIQNMAIK